MLIIKKDGKIILKIGDEEYTANYESEKLKPNSLYVYNKEQEGLANDD